MLSNHVWCLNSKHVLAPWCPMFFMAQLRSRTRCWLKPAFMSSPLPLPSCVSKALRRRTWKKGWEHAGTMWEPCGDSLCFLGLHICVFLWFWCVFLEVLICFQVLFWRVLRVLPGAKMVPSEDVTPSTSSSESTKDSPSPRFLSSLRSYSKKWIIDDICLLNIYLLHYLHIYIYIHNYTYIQTYTYIFRLEYANTVDLGFHCRITNYINGMKKQLRHNHQH